MRGVRPWRAAGCGCLLIVMAPFLAVAALPLRTGDLAGILLARAIAAAPAGATITVPAGTYRLPGELVIRRSLRLVSPGGATLWAYPVVAAARFEGGPNDVFEAEGIRFGPQPDTRGEAFRLVSGTAVFKRCGFVDGQPYGGGSSEDELAGGVGLVAHPGTRLTAVDCEFRDNRYGGASLFGCEAKLANCRFADNGSHFALQAVGGDVEVRRCGFSPRFTGIKVRSWALDRMVAAEPPDAPPPGRFALIDAIVDGRGAEPGPLVDVQAPGCRFEARDNELVTRARDPIAVAKGVKAVLAGNRVVASVPSTGRPAGQ